LLGRLAGSAAGVGEQVAAGMVSQARELRFAGFRLYAGRQGRLGIIQHKPVSVPNVLFQIGKRLPLTKYAWHLPQPPHVPAVIAPILQRELPFHA